MQWLIIQLTPWAQKTMTTKELAQEVRRRTAIDDLELYYPDIEDVVGKHDTPYAEYLFIEYRTGIPLQDLEGNDIFRFILRDAGFRPYFLQDAEIDKIRQAIESEDTLRPKEYVQINEGALRGNQGEVQYLDDGHVIVKVIVGDNTIESALPRKWVRRKGKPRKLPNSFLHTVMEHPKKEMNGNL